MDSRMAFNLSSIRLQEIFNPCCSTSCFCCFLCLVEVTEQRIEDRHIESVMKVSWDFLFDD